MARTMEMNNRAELNKAIYVVLTQLKRDAKEAHKVVKQAGYVIEKGRSSYIVSNPETKRSIYIGDAYGRGNLCVVHGWYKVHRSVFKGSGECKFDFVGCLEKPMNTVYWNSGEYSYNGNRSKAYVRYDELKSARWSVKYEADRIAEYEKQIKELQDKLMKATEQKVRDEFKLAEVRKELGLA